TNQQGRRATYGPECDRTTVPNSQQLEIRLRDPAARVRPSFGKNHSPRKTEGAGNAGCPLHPQPRVRNKTKHTSIVTTGPPDSARHSLRNGFSGLLRALPGDRACLSPSSCGSLMHLTRLGGCISAKLDASVGAPEPHDFAVRFSILRPARLVTAHGKPALPPPRAPMPPRPPHPVPNVRDDRETPLCGTGRRGISI